MAKMSQTRWLKENTDPLAMFASVQNKVAKNRLTPFKYTVCHEIPQLNKGIRSLIAGMYKIHNLTSNGLRVSWTDPEPWDMISWSLLSYKEPISTYRFVEWLLETFDNDELIKRIICEMMREVFGNPWSQWEKIIGLGLGLLHTECIQPDGKSFRFGETIQMMACNIRREQAFDRLPILADAIEEAGVTDEDMLQHLRGPTSMHRPECWALDLIPWNLC